MTTIELYRHEKAQSIARRTPLIDEARAILERTYPVTRQSYTAQNKAYYEANKARIYANRKARLAKARIGAA